MPHSDGAAAHDVIRLTGISATGRHGVLEHERREGQPFVADLELHLDLRPAAAGDRLDRTVHYGELAQRVHEVLAGPPADLIETVAERIAAVALVSPAVVAVEVTVHKPRAPIPVPFEDVAVRVRRSRSHPPVVPAPERGAETAAPPPPAAPPPAESPVPFAPVAVADLVVPSLEPDVIAPVEPPPTDAPRDRMDDVPEQPVPIVLALGSNIGPSEQTLRQVVADLAAVDGIELTDVSPLVRTAPIGGPPDQPDYLNAVVLGTTTLSPRVLLRACQAIEAAHGRVREEQWGPRTIDVDVVLHGTTVGVTDDLELPHPRAHQRAFVLQPWAHVAPDAVLPGLGGGPVAALAETAPDRDGIRWIALDWWRAPAEGTPQR